MTRNLYRHFMETINIGESQKEMALHSIEQLSIQIRTVETEILAQRTIIDSIEALIENEPEKISIETLSQGRGIDPQRATIMSRISNLKIQEVEMSKKYTDSNRLLVDLRKELLDLEQMLGNLGNVEEGGEAEAAPGAYELGRYPHRRHRV